MNHSFVTPVFRRGKKKFQVVKQSPDPPSDQRDGIWDKTRNKIAKSRNKIKGAAFFFVAPLQIFANESLLGTTAYDQVTEEETAVAYIYKMDRPWLQPGQLRVEIRQGHALWVIGRGDETVKVKLRRNNKMKLSEATASRSADGVLTVVIPKRPGPRKWYQYKDLALDRFKTVRVRISWS